MKDENGKWSKLEELLEIQNELLNKHFGYSNETDMLEEIRHELSEEIQKQKEKEPVDSVTATVMNKLAARSHVGVKSYSASMDRQDLSRLEWLIHLHEEMMDSSLYIQKLINIELELEREKEIEKVKESLGQKEREKLSLTDEEDRKAHAEMFGSPVGMLIKSKDINL